MRARELDDARDRALLRRCAGAACDDALDVPRGGCGIRVGATLEARDARHERGERRRRLQDQHRERVGAAARFEIALPQVQQVAARLHFDGAPQVGGVDAQRRKRAAARDDDVIGEDRAEFERKRVERLRELARRQEERRREAGVVPRLHARRRRAQVVARHRLDDRQRPRRRSMVVVRVGARLMCVTIVVAARRLALAVHRERLQAAAEDAAQIALERAHGVRDGHGPLYRM